MKLETVDRDPNTGSEIVHWILKYPVSATMSVSVYEMYLFSLTSFRWRTVNTCLSAELGSTRTKTPLFLSTGERELVQFSAELMHFSPHVRSVEKHPRVPQNKRCVRVKTYFSEMVIKADTHIDEVTCLGMQRRTTH